MTFTDAAASLAGEPFCLRPWEVARLTPRQVREIYGHQRDREGKVVATGEKTPPPLTERELFFRRYELIGLPTWYAEKSWREKGRAFRGTWLKRSSPTAEIVEFAGGYSHP